MQPHAAPVSIPRPEHPKTRTPFTLPYSLTLVLSYSHTLILLYSHTFIPSYSHTLILPYFHTLILSYFRTFMLSYFHTLILSYSHTFIPSYSHPYDTSRLPYSHTFQTLIFYEEILILRFYDDFQVWKTGSPGVCRLSRRYGSPILI